MQLAWYRAMVRAKVLFAVLLNVFGLERGSGKVRVEIDQVVSLQADKVQR